MLTNQNADAQNGGCCAARGSLEKTTFGSPSALGVSSCHVGLWLCQHSQIEGADGVEFIDDEARADMTEGGRGGKKNKKASALCARGVACCFLQGLPGRTCARGNAPELVARERYMVYVKTGEYQSNEG